MAHTFAAAVILGIDSAKSGKSGSTLLVPNFEPTRTALLGRAPAEVIQRAPRVVNYTFEHFCEVETQAHHEDCVQHLFTRARELNLPPIVSAETWTPGRWGFLTILGMGEGWGWWTAEMRRALERFPEQGPLHVERVVPNQWRDDLLGKGRPVESGALKREAVHYLHARTGIRVPIDVAEAGCVALWGAQNDEVHDAVRKWHVKQKQRAKRMLVAESE